MRNPTKVVPDSNVNMPERSGMGQTQHHCMLLAPFDNARLTRV